MTYTSIRIVLSLYCQSRIKEFLDRGEAVVEIEDCRNMVETMDVSACFSHSDAHSLIIIYDR